MNRLSIAVLALLVAQGAPTLAADDAASGTGISLPVILDQPLSSKTAQVGDRFAIRAAQDVRADGQILIPAGAIGMGEVTRVVRKGAFGRSGKIELRMVYVEGTQGRIPLEGLVERRGRSGKLPTIAVATVAGLGAGFVTGRSAEISAGSRLLAYLD